jgi:hypothetical protein
MRRKPTTPEEFAIARDLRERGLFFDTDEFEQMQTDCLGLSIMQNLDLPSTACDLRSGGAAYVFNTVIFNESPHKMLAPSFIDFDGPAWEPQLLLLPDPRLQTQRRNSL